MRHEERLFRAAMAIEQGRTPVMERPVTGFYLSTGLHQATRVEVITDDGVTHVYTFRVARIS